MVGGAHPTRRKWPRHGLHMGPIVGWASPTKSEKCPNKSHMPLFDTQEKDQNGSQIEAI
jgi:hypothetical protein